MKNGLIAVALIIGIPALLAANGGGMGGGGSMMGGSGMLVVADDGSLLITNMDMSSMMGGGSVSTTDREIVNIGSDGAERWRVSFSDGWPMMPVTDGDLVVVVLVDDWFMGSGGMGDGGWGGGMGGHMGGGTKAGDGDSVVIALDLATGAERWRATVGGDMASMAQFSPDGSKIYLSAVEMGSGQGMGQGSMRQGEAAGTGFMSSSTIVAFDRSGSQLWTYDVGGE